MSTTAVAAVAVASLLAMTFPPDGNGIRRPLARERRLPYAYRRRRGIYESVNARVEAFTSCAVTNIILLGRIEYNFKKNVNFVRIKSHILK